MWTAAELTQIIWFIGYIVLPDGRRLKGKPISGKLKLHMAGAVAALTEGKLGVVN